MSVQAKVFVKERTIFKSILKKYGAGVGVGVGVPIKCMKRACRGSCMGVVKIYEIHGFED